MKYSLISEKIITNETLLMGLYLSVKYTPMNNIDMYPLTRF